jgi:hypothetical protein
MCERFFESFRVKTLAPESPQILGSESAGRPQHPQRLVIGLVLIRFLASVQTRACVRHIYQDNNHDFPPVFNLPSGSPTVKKSNNERAMSGCPGHAQFTRYGQATVKTHWDFERELLSL